MSENTDKYRRIMSDYRNGAFGSRAMSVERILEAAGEPDLFERMTCGELMELVQESSGFTRMMFCEYLKMKRAEPRP